MRADRQGHAARFVRPCLCGPHAPRTLQTLAHLSVNLLAEAFALPASHANKGVLSSPRPIGHDWVYSVDPIASCTARLPAPTVMPR